MNKKKSVYIETTIPSYITAKDSRDLIRLAWQLSARNFWESERKKYELFIYTIFNNIPIRTAP
jgi:hypothetical protein